MTNNTSYDNSEMLLITLSKSMIERIDRQRWNIPRGGFIRRAIESYLKERAKNENHRLQLGNHHDKAE
jgi:hypothetical protein